MTTATSVSTRSWNSLCGDFAAQVTGDPVVAVYCHCQQCRQYASTAMQLAIFTPDNFSLVGSDTSAATAHLIKYESAPGIFRNSCAKCGSFAYKELGGNYVVPLGSLKGDGPTLKPTAHIFVAHKGSQDIPFPELPQYDELPLSRKRWCASTTIDKDWIRESVNRSYLYLY